MTFAFNPQPSGSASLELTGNAQATLALALSFGSGATIDPRIAATLHVAWTDTQGDLAGTITDLKLSNIGLDIGDLLPNFLTKVIGDVQTYTKPLQPIADFLSAEVPGLSSLGVNLSLKSLADLDNDPGVGQFVGVINLINSLPSDGNQGSGGFIPFGGDIEFAGNSLASIMAGGSDSNLIGNAVNSDSSGNLFSEADKMTEDPGSSSGFLSEATGSNGSFGFTFPIVTDPLHTVFQMLAGEDADLITFHASVSASLSAAAGRSSAHFPSSSRVASTSTLT